jgi:hypothetical protein
VLHGCNSSSSSSTKNTPFPDPLGCITQPTAIPLLIPLTTHPPHPPTHHPTTQPTHPPTHPPPPPHPPHPPTWCGAARSRSTPSHTRSCWPPVLRRPFLQNMGTEVEPSRAGGAPSWVEYTARHSQVSGSRSLYCTARQQQATTAQGGSQSRSSRGSRRRIQQGQQQTGGAVDHGFCTCFTQCTGVCWRPRLLLGTAVK